ncbi:MAG: hypothetical protein M1469_06145 [Bacteroidetes bacterium]|nr:hypothetical protein [Bacteroidota bacterium]
MQFGGCVLTIGIYYVLRSFVFKKIDKLWLRSATSGVLAYAFVWVVLFAVGKIILSANYSTSNSSSSVQAETDRKNIDLVASASKKYMSKDYAGALIDCDNALKENPNSDMAYFIRGSIRAATNDTTGAMEDLNHAIQLNPNSPEPYKIRSALRSQSDIQGALSDVSKVIELTHGGNATSFTARGELRLGDEKAAMGDFKKSKEMFNGEIAQDSTSAEAFHGRALAEMFLGDTGGACADLHKAYELGLMQAADEMKEFCQ